MKNLPIILLTIAVVVIYVLHFLPHTKNSETIDTIETARNTDFRVAFINNDTLLTYYDYYTDIKKELERKKTKAQRQLQTRSSKLQEKVISAEKRAKAGLMSANEIQRAQEKIAQDQQNLQIYSQTLTEGLIEEERIQQEKLMNKITDYIKIYNQSQQYDLILNYATGGTLWYGNKSMDITQDVLTQLNEAYDEEKSQFDQPK